MTSSTTWARTSPRRGSARPWHCWPCESWPTVFGRRPEGDQPNAGGPAVRADGAFHVNHVYHVPGRAEVKLLERALRAQERLKARKNSGQESPTAVAPKPNSGYVINVLN